MFNKDSMLVKIWVKKISGEDSKYSLDDVPRLFNLYDVVSSIVNH